MQFKITTLVENAVPIMGDRKLIGEHGLSFLIETRGHRLLFDTGHVHQAGQILVAGQKKGLILGQ